MNTPMRLALRALRDCGLIRATGITAYVDLAAGGYAAVQRRRVGDRWVTDYRLTLAGRDAATRLPRLPGDIL